MAEEDFGRCEVEQDVWLIKAVLPHDMYTYNFIASKRCMDVAVAYDRKAKNENKNRPRTSINVEPFSFQGSYNGETASSEITGFFTDAKGNRTKILGDTVKEVNDKNEEKGMSAYYVGDRTGSEGKESSILNKYDPENTETAPIHVGVQYYIRAR